MIIIIIFVFVVLFLMDAMGSGFIMEYLYDLFSVLTDGIADGWDWLNGKARSCYKL